MTQTILHIDASALGDASESRRLSATFIEQWLQQHPDDKVVVRDIVDAPLPHLDGATLAALMTDAEQRDPTQAEAAARVDELVDEFLGADVLVLGVPMYNFGIPSTLKAWIDHIAIAGRTFRYTADGPVGLAGGKRVYVLSARGGLHGEGSDDHQVRYLRTLFRFLGIDDVRVIQAEGLSISSEQREQSISAALSDIARQFEVPTLA